MEKNQNSRSGERGPAKRGSVSGKTRNSKYIDRLCQFLNFNLEGYVYYTAQYYYNTFSQENLSLFFMNNSINFERYVSLVCIFMSYYNVDSIKNKTSLLRVYFQHDETRVVLTEFFQLLNCCYSYLEDEEGVDEDDIFDETDTTNPKHLSHELLSWLTVYTRFCDHFNPNDVKAWYFFIAFVESFGEKVKESQVKRDMETNKATGDAKKDEAAKRRKERIESMKIPVGKQRIDMYETYHFYNFAFEHFLKQFPLLKDGGIYAQFQIPPIEAFHKDVLYLRTVFVHENNRKYVGNIASLTSIKWVMIHHNDLSSTGKKPTNGQPKPAASPRKSNDMKRIVKSLPPTSKSTSSPTTPPETLQFLKNYFPVACKRLKDAMYDYRVEMRVLDPYIDELMESRVYFLTVQEHVICSNLYFLSLTRVIETETLRYDRKNKIFDPSLLTNNVKFKKSLLFACLISTLFVTGGFGKLKIKYILTKVLQLDFEDGVKSIEFFVREVLENPGKKKNNNNKNNNNLVKKPPVSVQLPRTKVISQVVTQTQNKQRMKVKAEEDTKTKTEPIAVPVPVATQPIATLRRRRVNPYHRNYDIFGEHDILRQSLKRFLRYVEEKFFNYFLFISNQLPTSNNNRSNRNQNMMIDELDPHQNPHEQQQQHQNTITRKFTQNDMLWKKCCLLTHQKVQQLVYSLVMGTDGEVNQICECIIYVIQIKLDMQVVYLDHVLLCATYIILNKFKKNSGISFKDIILHYTHCSEAACLKTPIELNKILFRIPTHHNVIQYYNKFFIHQVKKFIFRSGQQDKDNSRMIQEQIRDRIAPLSPRKKKRLRNSNFFVSPRSFRVRSPLTPRTKRLFSFGEHLMERTYDKDALYFASPVKMPITIRSKKKKKVVFEEEEEEEEEVKKNMSPPKAIPPPKKMKFQKIEEDVIQESILKKRKRERVDGVDEVEEEAVTRKKRKVE